MKLVDMIKSKKIHVSTMSMLDVKNWLDVESESHGSYTILNTEETMCDVQYEDGWTVRVSFVEHQLWQDDLVDKSKLWCLLKSPIDLENDAEIVYIYFDSYVEANKVAWDLTEHSINNEDIIYTFHPIRIMPMRIMAN